MVLVVVGGYLQTICSCKVDLTLVLDSFSLLAVRSTMLRFGCFGVALRFSGSNAPIRL